MPHIRVPYGALAALGSSAELRLMIENFFSSVHTYFPIVSKIRLYQHLANPLHEPGAEVALLFMAMKLVSTELPEGSPPQTQVYQDVKSFYTYMEAQNGFSIQMLQGLLLISLYEYGHGIYPAAYLSIGNAARLGHAMGLHARDVPQMLPRCTTWTEQEERRRVWWGVLILDRISNIGHRGKPFASAEPSPDMHLPTDDAAWDRGQMLAAAPLSLSASQTIRASSFARACQSVHLAGKVCRHIDDKTTPLDYRFEEALQLHRTLKALAALLPTEAEGEDPTAGPTLCSSLAICYSALLTLYDAYGCSERLVPDAPESQLVMQKESIQGIAEVCESVLLLSRKIRQRIELGESLGRLSPLTIECIYEAGASYAWYLRETSEPHYAEKLAEVKELLRLCERKWRVAGDYIRIIEATEYQLEDSQGMVGRSKGKQREGTFTDAEYALRLYIDDLETTSTALKDRKMAQSFAKSVMEDAELIEQVLKDEQQAAIDREFATSIDNQNGDTASGSRSNLPATAIKDPWQDSEILEKAAAIYMHTAEMSCNTTPALTADDESDVETIAESSAWAASRPRDTKPKTGHCIACGDDKDFFDVARVPCKNKHEYCRECLAELFRLSLTDESLFPPRCDGAEIPLDYLSTANRVYCHDPSCAIWIPKSLINEDTNIMEIAQKTRLYSSSSTSRTRRSGNVAPSARDLSSWTRGVTTLAAAAASNSATSAVRAGKHATVPTHTKPTSTPERGRSLLGIRLIAGYTNLLAWHTPSQRLVTRPPLPCLTMPPPPAPGSTPLPMSQLGRLQQQRQTTSKSKKSSRTCKSTTTATTAAGDG
ncbi:hypothetical protein KC332_g13203 [Hortaea werneckii]|nr:hypothetical protein KC358_g13178 [Hortaea werneckii]KAI6835059.1 hypothetical protein KC350_g6593 [Hortaea werneckii]KAI6909721.1 hypothetical protein KC348_g13415 [Hortaea werneckii]KAI6935771.1 hypothetical protein KC341_g6679 [Hortaea werneckii]KAI6960376.1 hypothetical protein KC321_g12885 [Hortaea werneckii]